MTTILLHCAAATLAWAGSTGLTGPPRQIPDPPEAAAAAPAERAMPVERVMPPPGAARAPTMDRLRRLLSDKPRERRRAVRALGKSDPATLVPLVDAYFFASREARADMLGLMEQLSGEQPGSRYRDWFLHVGSREDLETPPGYVAWKGELFSRIDPVYGRILGPRATVHLRLREVQSGGVPLDGIPAIDDPESVPAEAARFMRATDAVFGVSLGGERRAYPVKVLSWHELLNDTLGGQPITLSFCTLCGSGILYSAVDEEGNRLRFGTSGLLYRSNKLMFDRSTLSLWTNLTGEAVVGPRAETGARLEMLPMTLTRWDVWRRRHPDTTIMRPDPGSARRTGYRYVEGAADRARTGVEFPVLRRSDALERNARIYALKIEGEAKAYPFDKLRAERVVNDALGGRNIVLVLDAASDAVRAYERRSLGFRLPDAVEEQGPLQALVATDGTTWRIAEENLAPAEGGDDREPLPRVPGHTAFWFGWYAFHSETTVY